MDRPDLADELVGMAEHDVEVRTRLAESGELFGGYHPEMRAVHRHNGDRLSAILDEVGCWPGHRLVGHAGSEAAFLIGQHDIANPRLLRRCRDLYRDAVDAVDAEPGRLAALEDRVRYFEGRPQKYGTHTGWNEQGHFGPWPPIENLAEAERDRRVLGLPPLAEAIDRARGDRPGRRPVEEVLDEHRRADEFARSVGWRDRDT